MTRWVITVQKVREPSGEYQFDTLGEFEGDRPEALKALLKQVNTYSPAISKVRRRRVYRYGDSESSYYVHIEGRFLSSREYLFQLAELVADTEDERFPSVAPVPAPQPEDGTSHSQQIGDVPRSE